MARRTAIVTLLVWAGVTGAAHADGAPVLGLGGGNGVVGSRDGRFTYEALPGRGSTTVKAIAAHHRGTLSVRIPGLFTVPLVTYSGTDGGLSGDGRTLVLERPRTRFPQARSHLAILAADSLRTERILALRGDFSFDAVSPDGRWIYLIQYTSHRDSKRYRVRVLDAGDGRLQPGAIVDPTEPDEKMQGEPQWRVMSPDGRWAYTLYGGAGRPFVHALDTVGRRARCLDLPASLPSGAYPSWWLRLTRDGRVLTVTGQHGPLATIDTATWNVTAAKPAPKPAKTPERHDSAGTIGIAFPIAVGLLLLGGGLLVLRRRVVRPT
jgi:hypothetical protein